MRAWLNSPSTKRKEYSPSVAMEAMKGWIMPGRSMTGPCIGHVGLGVADLRAGAAADLAFQHDVIHAEGGHGVHDVVARGRFGPERGDDGDAARLELAQVGLADVPADGGGVVEDGDAEGGDAVERGEEVLVPVLIIPRAVDQDGAEARPVDGGRSSGRA